MRWYYGALRQYLTSKRKILEYRTKGIIGENDGVIIAINICRLSDWDVDGNGISQFPLVMEAVMPIGPLCVPILPDGELDGPMQNAARYEIQKTNGEPIQTWSFLDPAFSHVSAIIQAYQLDMHEKPLILSTVHNPLSKNPLPIGLFSPRKEFVAEEEGDHYLVKDVVGAHRC